MKRIIYLGIFFLLLGVVACKKDNPKPAQQNVDLLAHKWTFVQFDTQDFPNIGQPALVQTVIPPSDSYWEFKPTSELDIFAGAGSGMYSINWARIDNNNFLMTFSSICLISVLDAHNLTFSRTETYNDGITKFTYVFTR